MLGSIFVLIFKGFLLVCVCMCNEMNDTNNKHLDCVSLVFICCCKIDVYRNMCNINYTQIHL